MTIEQFQLMIQLVRKAWTKRNGIIIRLQRQEDDRHPLLLCVGALANKGFIAQNCKVWQHDDLLYEGPLNSDDLKQLLDEQQICYAEINHVKRLDVHRGLYTCLGDRSTCQYDCELRRAKKAQIGSVDILIK